MNRAALVRSSVRVPVVFAALLGLVGALACSTSAPEAPAPVRQVPGTAPGGRKLDPSAVRTRAHPSVLDSLGDLDNTPEPSLRTPEQAVGQVASAATLDLAAPPHGCVVVTRSPTRVLSAGGPASIAAAPGGFVVAGYVPSASGETVVVVRLSPSSPTVPLATLTLGAASRAPRLAPPVVTALDSGRVLVAATDARGGVRAVTLGVSSPTMGPELRALGAGADLRFAPAVAPLRGGAAALAYTDGSATPMRVRLVVVRPDLSIASTRDVTPPSLGASAPVFDRLAELPELVFLDAHGGLSPVVRVALAEDGTPRAPQIDRPLSTVSEPARLATAHVGSRRFVAYTAIGRAATSAIGLVELGGTLPVEPLVPGEGYGALQLAAVSAPAAALFAMTRPAPGVAAAERFNGQLLVRLVDEAGIGPALSVTAPDERVSHAAIARAENGTVGVAYTTAAGVHVQWLRCADR